MANIRACIWREVGRGRESKTVSFEVEGNFNDKAFVHKVVENIFKEYPGWQITGFVEAN